MPNHPILYCLPYAGGSTQIYNGWAEWPTPLVDVHSIQLPGRGRRFGQPSFRDVNSATAYLLETVINTAQGCQFTSADFNDVLKAHKIQMSMDRRGRCHDNIFIERLGGGVKRECIYLRPLSNGIAQQRSIGGWFDWYNRRRPDHSLAWQSPNEVYFGALAQAQPTAA